MKISLRKRNLLYHINQLYDHIQRLEHTYSWAKCSRLTPRYLGKNISLSEIKSMKKELKELNIKFEKLK